MSRKGKIFFTIMQACLIVTIMMIGVFSLMSKSFTISNQISFTAVDVAATVSVVVTKNVKGGTPISATIAGMADGTFNIDATNKDTTERIVSASDLTFNGSGIENSIDYKVTIKNNGSRIIKVNFDVTTLTANLQANGITATKIDGGPIAENATGTYVFKMVLGTKAIDVPKIEIKLPFNLSVLTPNQVSDFTYSKIDAGTHIEITGYTGASPMVVFPETIENLPVTSIGANAFSGNTSIKGVFFPNGLTKICNNAFSNCSGIVDSLIFPNSVTSIGDSAFYGCSGVTGALTIPNSVTSLGKWAFYNCSGFNGSLTIGSGLTAIPGGAFQNCTGFTGSLSIPNSVITIGSHAFYGGSKFNGSLLIPNFVTSIGDYAFYGCSGFNFATIGSGVTNIGVNSFYGCIFKEMEMFKATAPTLENAPFDPAVQVIWVPNETALTDYRANASWQPYLSKLNIKSLFTFTSIDGGNAYSVAAKNNTIAVSNLIIPSSYNGKPVTTIASEAFYNCTNLTGSLTISSSVTRIDSRAFHACSGFNGTLILGNSVASIGNDAFQSCRGFTGSLIIPSSLKRIGNSAFSYCNNFTGDLIIPNTVSIIEESAFWGCYGLNGALSIGSGITAIASHTFYACSGFKSATISGSVASIGDYAFDGCDNLAEVEMLGATPPTLTGSSHFAAAVQTIWVPDETALTAYRKNTTWQPYLSKLNIKSLFNFTPIDGGNAYSVAAKNNTIAVSNLIIPSSYNGKPVTTIADNGFKECTNLSGTLTLPATLTNIGKSAFENCHSFTGVLTIPNSVASMGEGAFYCCCGISSLAIGSGITAISKNAFIGCSGLKGNLEIPSTVTYIGVQAFQGCGITGSINIPASVTGIDASAFYNCSGTAFNINAANVNYSNDSQGILYDKNKTILFQCLTSKTGAVTIPNSVTTIDYGAFFNCSGMTFVTIGSGMTRIAHNSFNNCTFKEVEMLGATPPTLDGANHFPATVQVIWVPNETALTAYRANASWQSYLSKLNIKSLFTFTSIDGGNAYSVGEGFALITLNNLVIPSIYLGKPVTTIASDGFLNCKSLTGTLEIPNSVTTIGNDAFRDCDGFAGTLTIPNSVTYIGYNAFANCGGTAFIVDAANVNFSNDSQGFLYNKNQTTLIQCLIGKTGAITIPNSVTNIGVNSFYGCSGLTDTLTIPSSVTNIGVGAFFACSGLSGMLTIPFGVTNIASYTFYGCSGFTGSLIIPNSVTTIDYGAFSYCSGMTFVTIGSGVTSIGAHAFNGCNNLAEVEMLGATPPTLDGASHFPATIQKIYVPESALAAYKANTTWQPFWDKIFSIENRIFIFDIPTKTITGHTNYGSTIVNLKIPATIGGVPVDAIGGKSFAWNSTIQTVVIAEGVQRIDGPVNNTAAFDGCPNLVSISFPSTLTSLGFGAFWSCPKLSEVIFPENSSLEIIYGAVFHRCTALETIALPSSVKVIHYAAFEICTALKEVKMLGAVPPTLEGAGHFPEETQVIWVPNETALTAYRANASWQPYLSKLNIKSLFTFTSIDGGNAYSVAAKNNTIVVDNFVIPSSYLGKPVTTLASEAFYNCTNLTGTLTIPFGVTTIGMTAFAGCSGLTGTLTIPGSVTTIGGSAFHACRGFTGSLIIPSSVTSLGIWAFDGCSGFSGTPTIPNSVTSIGNGTFYGCSGFSGTLLIPETVTGIGSHAFYACSGLSGMLTIPASVNSIGDYAFDVCTNLATMTVNAVVPPTLTNVNAISAATTKIYVPAASLQAYKTAAIWLNFADKIFAIASPAANFSYSKIDNNTHIEITGYTGSETTVVIPETFENLPVTSIGTTVFQDNKTMKNIVMPSSLTNIGYASFRRSLLSGELVIPHGVETIGDFAFDSCYELFGAITLPSTLKNIRHGVFHGSYRCTSIVIPASVTVIDGQPFSWTPIEISVESANPNFSSIDGVLFNKNQTTLIECNGGKMGAYTIPSSVTSIGSGSFLGCNQLESVSIPESIQTINGYAFAWCEKLRTINIPSKVNAIEEALFRYCKSLGSIALHNGITEIKTNAFFDCSVLSTISIPMSVTSIGSHAFYNCTNLATMQIDASAVPTLADVPAISVATTRIVVPAASLDAYKTAAVWLNFADKIFANRTADPFLGTFKFLNASEISTVVSKLINLQF